MKPQKRRRKPSEKAMPDVPNKASKKKKNERTKQTDSRQPPPDEPRGSLQVPAGAVPDPGLAGPSRAVGTSSSVESLRDRAASTNSEIATERSLRQPAILGGQDHKQEADCVAEKFPEGTCKPEASKNNSMKTDEQQPLVIVYQNAKQLARMTKFGQNIVFLDATYKGITAYGYALYCLLARDDKGHGTPLAFMVTSDDNSEVIAVFLKQLKISAESHQIVFEPRSFMVDKDLKEKKAINEVFPRSAVLLCWFHVLQAIYRWLNRQVSGVSGPANAAKRQEIVNYVREMRMCTKEEKFEEMSNNIGNIMPPAVVNYLQENWTNIGREWSNFGRPFFHEDHNTNNLVERFFLGMKYHFLGGYGNTRVEELLLLLDGEVASLFNYMEELSKAGRLGNSTRKNNGKEEAIKLLRNGYAGFLEWITDTICLVPSTKNMTVKYKVDIIRATCECLAATNYGMCKHVHVAFTDAAQREKSLEQLRMEKAAEIVADGTFHCHDDGYMEIFDTDGHVGMVNRQNHSCLCVAYSHSIKCVCLYVEELVNISVQHQEEPSQIEADFEIKVRNEEDDNFKYIKNKIQTKIEDIHKWANSADISSCCNNRSILEQVDILHTTIFGNFTKRTRKRKINPLHPYRKTLALNKNQNKQMEHKDHLYCGENQSNSKKVKSLATLHKKTLPDGSFKRKNRSGHCLRKPFN